MTATDRPEVRRLRQALRLSQGELAAFLGVTRATVARWEAGEPMPYAPLELLRREVAARATEGAPDPRGAAWSPADDAAALDPSRPAAEVAAELGRTPKAVRRRRHRLRAGSTTDR